MPHNSNTAAYQDEDLPDTATSTSSQRLPPKHELLHTHTHPPNSTYKFHMIHLVVIPMYPLTANSPAEATHTPRNTVRSDHWA